jgi:lysozyme family protein
MQFGEALNIVLSHEGGYANVTGDRGGETYRGISRVNWPNWPGWQIIDQNKPLKNNQVIKNTLLDNLVSIFYKIQFWDAIQADKLPASIRPLAFDFAVNSGTKTAITSLQKVLVDTTGKKIAIDGRIGQQTIALANQVQPKVLFDNYKNARLQFFNNIVANNPGQKKFLKGWLNRLNSFQYTAVITTGLVLFSLLAYLAFRSN